jgi:tRNA A58 N-methylase Trm61
MDQPDARTPRALAELAQTIHQQWPDARLEVCRGEDPAGIYLRVIVDIADPDEVTDAISDRLLAIQVEGGLPIYVIAVRPLDRVLEEQRRRQAVEPRVVAPTEPSRAPAGAG